MKTFWPAITGDECAPAHGGLPADAGPLVDVPLRGRGGGGKSPRAVATPAEVLTGRGNCHREHQQQPAPRLLLVLSMAVSAGARVSAGVATPGRTYAHAVEHRRGDRHLLEDRRGPGRSSPVMAPAEVFITAEPALLVCLDRSGKVLWRREGEQGLPACRPDSAAREAGRRPPRLRLCHRHPVTDGKFIYASYGARPRGLPRPGRQAAMGSPVRRARNRSEQYGRTTSPLLVGNVLPAVVGPNHLIALPRERTSSSGRPPDAKTTYGIGHSTHRQRGRGVHAPRRTVSA